jgi:hypothetical protein
LSLLKLLLPRGQPSVLPPPEVDPKDEGGHEEASGPQGEAVERKGEAALLYLLKLLLPRGQPPVLPPPKVNPEDKGGHKKASGPKDDAGERESKAAHAQALFCVELRGHLSF